MSATTELAQLRHPQIALPRESAAFLVDPKTASVWRTRYHYEGQRTFSPTHAHALARMMREGIFRPKTQIAFAALGERLYLTNGQHTLAAIEEAGVSVLLSVAINQVRSEEEVADDFARQDTHLTRRFADSLVAHRINDELGITATDLHRITAACIYFKYIKDGTEGRSSIKSVTHDEKLLIVRQLGQLAVSADSYFEGFHNRSYLTRKTTLVSAMLCAEKEPDLATEFWRAVAMDDGLKIGDPRKTLLEYLRSRTTPGGAVGRVNSQVRVAADHELMKAIGTAWSYWIANKELKMLKVDFDKRDAIFDRIGVFAVRPQSRKALMDSK